MSLILDFCTFSCPYNPQIIGSVVDFEGETIFTENRVVEFGALQLLSLAQIRFMNGSRMKFDRNIGKYVIKTPTLSIAKYSLTMRAFVVG